MGRELTQAEASSVLFRRGVRWAVTHPAQELSLAARKLYYFWNRTESPTNLSFAFARRFSSLLRALPFDWGVVAPLGIAGMIAARRRWREQVLLHLAIVVPLVTCLLFFVSAEYRLPAAAPLILFGAYALARAWVWGHRKAERRGERSAGARPSRARRRRSTRAVRRRVACADCGAAGAGGVQCKDAAAARADAEPCRLLQLRRALQAARRSRARRGSAAAFARDRSALRAGAGRAAEVEHRRGNTAEAMQALDRARRLDPSVERVASADVGAEDQPRIEAERLYQAGSYEAALPAFETARDRYLAAGREDDATSMVNNIGLTLYKLGRLSEAQRTLEEIIARHPDYVRAHTNLALVHEAQGRPTEAAAEYRRALEIEPGTSARGERWSGWDCRAECGPRGRYTLIRSISMRTVSGSLSNAPWSVPPGCSSRGR
jgi:tetratricopeptide (TPR) repeat protein